VSLARSAVIDGAGPGIWAECSNCNCQPTGDVTLHDTLVRGDAVVGISFAAVNAELDNVLVADTHPGSDFQYGGGMAISACAAVSAHGLTVADSADFGVLVDGARLDVDAASFRGNLRGLWAQNLNVSAAGLSVHDVELAANRGFGLGIAGYLGDGPVSVTDTRVTDTLMAGMPCLQGGIGAGSMQVGDGVYWQGVTADFAAVEVRDSARVGVLLDGPAAGTLADVVPTGSSPGIVQVHYAAGPQPDVSGATPAILVDDGSILGPDPCR
jgi:hypothetical protein